VCESEERKAVVARGGDYVENGEKEEEGKKALDRKEGWKEGRGRGRGQGWLAYQARQHDELLPSSSSLCRPR